MQLICKNDRVIILDLPKGSTVTIINNDAANDVYFDGDAARLLASLAGNVPSGTKLAHGGGQLQVANWNNPLYFRAVVDGTSVDVQS